MSDAIPFKKLEEGLQKIQRNVKSLIESAKLLLDNGKVYHSSVFSILAIEELAKAHVLKVAKSEKKDLPFEEWNTITKKPRMHFKKWKVYLGKQNLDPEFSKRHPEVTKDIIDNLMAEFHTNFKNKVLYVDWDKRLNNWYWLPAFFPWEGRKRSVELLNAAVNMLCQ